MGKVQERRSSSPSPFPAIRRQSVFERPAADQGGWRADAGDACAHYRTRSLRRLRDTDAGRWSRPAHFPGYTLSPLPPDIQKDVNSVLGEFTSLPANVQNLLKTALNAVLGQSMYAKSIAEQFDTVSNAIKSQLAKVQQSLPTTLSAISAMDDTGNVAALESCINTIVSMGGRQTEKDGTCLTQSGYSLDSLTSQFKTFGKLVYKQEAHRGPERRSNVEQA